MQSRIFQGIMLRANFAQIKCSTKMLKLYDYNIDQFYNKYSCNFQKNDLRFFDQNHRFLRLRLATPAKCIVKSILKFLKKMKWQFGLVVKH